MNILNSLSSFFCLLCVCVLSNTIVACATGPAPIQSTQEHEANISDDPFAVSEDWLVSAGKNENYVEQFLPDSDLTPEILSNYHLVRVIRVHETRYHGILVYRNEFTRSDFPSLKLIVEFSEQQWFVSQVLETQSRANWPKRH